MIAGQLALAAAALFSGAALYVSFVEHPARRALQPAPQLAEWKPAYARGKVMQGALAIAGFALGAAAFASDGRWEWLAGAFLMLANWPYTLLVIMPANRRLEATAPDAAGAETVALLDRWAALHGGRTALGLLATIVFVAASIR